MMTPSLFHDDFDFFNRLYRNPWFGFNDREFKDLEKKLYGRRAKNVMNTDIKESASGYEMTIDLPGFSKDEVSVALENGYLTISAAKALNQEEDKGEDAEEKGSYIRRERYCGSCQRSFYVGEVLSVEDIRAAFSQGILTLFIPKKDKKAVEANKYIAIEG